MKILILGKGGQVGRSLTAQLPEAVAVGRQEADLEQPETIQSAIDRYRPEVIVNAAAYTNVDAAESDRDRAWAINATALEAVGTVAKRNGILVVHYSSDYVYPGPGREFQAETEPTGPLSVYGASKLAGDMALAQSGADHIILRTSWVYSAEGRNFPLTLLRLAGERETLNVVDDQFGAPTSAKLIAEITRQVIARRELGLYHLAASGETNWYELARFLLAQAQAAGAALALRLENIRPIPASDYPAKATRPENSRLDTSKLRQTFGLTLPSWQDGITELIATLAAKGWL
ncbi:MAG: dTDP-4-dehydrorhamnose reductase [Devosia sp.]